jgi:hypothetical protein
MQGIAFHFNDFQELRRDGALAGVIVLRGVQAPYADRACLAAKSGRGKAGGNGQRENQSHGKERWLKGKGVCKFSELTRCRGSGPAQGLPHTGIDDLA